MNTFVRKLSVAIAGVVLVCGVAQARQIGGSSGYYVGYATLTNGSQIGVGPYASATDCTIGLNQAIAAKQAQGYVIASVQGCKYVPGFDNGTGTGPDSTK